MSFRRAVERARQVSSPLQHYNLHHHNAFRPIIDVYANSLSARSDIRSPGQNCPPQWSITANYLGDPDDDDDDGREEAWAMTDEDCTEMMRRRYQQQQQPPAYSHSPPQQPAYRPTLSPPAPILRPDNYTLKRPVRNAAPLAVVDVPVGETTSSSQYEPVKSSGHLLAGADYEAEPTPISGDTADSGYSLQRSTAPPSPAPLDNVWIRTSLRFIIAVCYTAASRGLNHTQVALLLFSQLSATGRRRCGLRNLSVVCISFSSG